MERTEGYYWVMTASHEGNRWMVAHWDGRWWALPGNEWDFKDHDFLKIKDERLQEPD